MRLRKSLSFLTVCGPSPTPQKSVQQQCDVLQYPGSSPMSWDTMPKETSVTTSRGGRSGRELRVHQLSGETGRPEFCICSSSRLIQELIEKSTGRSVLTQGQLRVGNQNNRKELPSGRWQEAQVRGKQTPQGKSSHRHTSGNRCNQSERVSLDLLTNPGYPTSDRPALTASGASSEACGSPGGASRALLVTQRGPSPRSLRRARGRGCLHANKCASSARPRQRKGRVSRAGPRARASARTISEAQLRKRRASLARTVSRRASAARVAAGAPARPVPPG
jgi:hypothetical protein